MIRIKGHGFCPLSGDTTELKIGENEKTTDDIDDDTVSGGAFVHDKLGLC